MSCPYVPVKADPKLPAVPEPSLPPVRTDETLKNAEASASVSLSSIISPEPSVTVKVSPSFTVPVSLAATGASLTPATLIEITAVSVCDPLVTV